MDQPSQRAFEKDLDEIKSEISMMAGMVEKAIATSILSLKERNTRLAKEVIRADRDIDAQELKIDNLCLKYIALQQPKASDLRFITSVMKINNELERIGDYAEYIGRQSLFLASVPPLRPLVNIPIMAEVVQRMVKDSIQAILEKNEALARAGIKRDQEVDEIQQKIYKNLLNDMIQDPTTIERATSLLVVATKLERMADHSTNICEDVIFLITGITIRHQGKF